MSFSYRTNKFWKWIFITSAIYTVSGCSTVAEKNNAWFDSKLVNKMFFKFDHESTFFGAHLPEQAIASEISANLSEWGYNIHSKGHTDYSHNVTIEIGSIKHDSTPAGFSFSTGNSNPRSPNFQKADVLPMRCFLTPTDQPTKSAELEVVVNADDYLRYADDPSQQQKLVKLLVNDLSTACFNLLDNLKVKTLSPDQSKKPGKPSWIPAIRVEVENDVETDLSSSAETAGETAQITEEPRKRIIIHNQGNPVIFKFGHDR